MTEKNMPNWNGLLLLALSMTVWAKERNETIKAAVKVDFYSNNQLSIVMYRICEENANDKNKNVKF